MRLIFFILFILLLPFFVFGQTLEIHFQAVPSIPKKYAEDTLELIRYWAKTKTSFTLAPTGDFSLLANLRETNNQFILEVSLLDKKNNKMRQAVTQFSRFTEIFEALDNIFYQNIFAERIVDAKKDYLVPPQLLDIAFVIDTTGSMKDELISFRNSFREIFSSLFWNCQNYRIRFAFLDYKNESAPYRVQLLNFENKLDKIEKRLWQIEAVGQGTKSDITYALLYLLTYGNFFSPNRIVFVITDRGPKNEKALEEVLMKAAKMNVQVFIIAAGGILEKDAAFYKKAVALTKGDFVFLPYFLVFLTAHNQLLQFLYQNPTLFEITEKGEKDISLGRKINAIEEIETFLRKEQYPITKLKEQHLLFPQAISQLTTRFYKKIPIIELKTENQIIRIPVSDKKNLALLKNKKGQKVIIGGHFFPYFDTVSIFPYTVFVRNEPPLKLLIQPLSSFIKNPFFYYNNGLFEPSVWYISGTVQDIE